MIINLVWVYNEFLISPIAGFMKINNLYSMLCNVNSEPIV